MKRLLLPLVSLTLALGACDSSNPDTDGSENASAGGKADELGGEEASSAQFDLCIGYEICADDIGPEGCSPAPAELEAFCCAGASEWGHPFFFCEPAFDPFPCGDGSFPTCEIIPPTCPPGQVPEAIGGCFGECVDAETCEPVDGPGDDLFPCGDGSFPTCEIVPPNCGPGMTSLIIDSCFGPCVDANTCEPTEAYCDGVDDGFGDCVVEFDATGQSCISDDVEVCCDSGSYTMCSYL